MSDRVTHLELHKRYDDRTVFRVTGGDFEDPAMAIAVSMGSTAPHVSLRDVGALAENFIVSNMQDQFKGNEPRVLVIDLQSFPFPIAYVDKRDQRELNSDVSQFSKDIIALWESYDHTTEIPLIIVNLDIEFTGLKRIRIKQPK
jgi:hypothetical protein